MTAVRFPLMFLSSRTASGGSAMLHKPDVSFEASRDGPQTVSASATTLLVATCPSPYIGKELHDSVELIPKITFFDIHVNAVDRLAVHQTREKLLADLGKNRVGQNCVDHATATVQFGTTADD